MALQQKSAELLTRRGIKGVEAANLTLKTAERKL